MCLIRSHKKNGTRHRNRAKMAVFKTNGAKFEMNGWVVSHISEQMIVCKKGNKTRQHALNKCQFIDTAYERGNENSHVSAEYAVLHNHNEL